MAPYSDKNIIASWLQNAKPWIKAIRTNEIESRSLSTNKAIIEAILEKEPKKVLDIGCGEGWLARALHNSGIEVHGVDVIPELIEEANIQGAGTFQVLSYEDLSQNVLKDTFDIAVCNFSLLGNESVSHVFKSVTDLLNGDGYFIIQTLHPLSGDNTAEYKDGWRKGSWAGFSDNFTNPPPWYFRTMETWLELFEQNGFGVSEIFEPLHPKTKSFASIIFVAEMNCEV